MSNKLIMEKYQKYGDIYALYKLTTLYYYGINTNDDTKDICDGIIELNLTDFKKDLHKAKIIGNMLLVKCKTKIITNSIKNDKYQFTYEILDKIINLIEDIEIESQDIIILYETLITYNLDPSYKIRLAKIYLNEKYFLKNVDINIKRAFDLYLSVYLDGNSSVITDIINLYEDQSYKYCIEKIIESIDILNIKNIESKKDIETKNNKLENKNNELDNKNYELENKNSKLKNINSELEIKNQNYIKNIASKDIILKELKLEKQNLEQKNNNITEENKNLSSFNKQLELDVNFYIKEYNDVIEEEKKKYILLEEKYNESLTKNNLLDDVVNLRHTDNEKSEKIIKNLINDIDELSFKNSNLEASLNKKTIMLTEIQKKYEDMNKENLDLIKENDKLNYDFKDLCDKVDDNDIQSGILINSLKKEISNINEINTLLEKNITNSNMTIINLNKNNEILINENTKSQTHITNLNNIINKEKINNNKLKDYFNNEYSKMLANKTELIETNKMLTNDINIKNDKYIELLENKEIYNKKILLLTDELNDMKNKYLNLLEENSKKNKTKEIIDNFF